MNDLLTTLRNQIDRASMAYYRNTPIISDKVFDAYIEQLAELDPTDPRLTRVGPPFDPANTRTKVTHLIPCGSLDNIDGSIDGFDEWYAKVGKPVINLSPKIDGSSIRLTYKDGQLVCAATRGNGLVGEDVTANAAMFIGIPVVANVPDSGLLLNGEIRGEAVLFKADFEELVAGVAEDDISNPRNEGNGIIGRKNGTNSHLIRFLAFKLHQYDDQGNPIEKDLDQQLETLREYGFTPVDYQLCHNSQEVKKAFADLIAKRDSLPYGIDGAVVIANSIDVQHELTDDESALRPKYGRAIKPPLTTQVSTLLGVNLTVGHTGAIIPTGVIKRTRIGGVFVENVLLNNWDEIQRLEVAIGDSVVVGLAGDIIPKIIDVVHRPDDRVVIDPPSICPVCGSAATNVHRGIEHANHFCTNENCPGVQIAKVDHWIGNSKKGIGILGIGDTILQALIDNGMVADPADLYTITVDQLANVTLSGGGKIGESRATTIVDNINNSRSLKLSKFLGALGIDLLGSRRAELMIKVADGELNTLNDWLDDNKLATIQLEGFGDIQRKAIRAGIDKCRPLIAKLLANGVKPLDVEKVVVNGVAGIAGKSFCATGTRKFLPELEAAGAIIKSGVSKGLDYLIQVDPSSTTSKSKKALEYGTKIIGLEQVEAALKGEAALP